MSFISSQMSFLKILEEVSEGFQGITIRSFQDVSVHFNAFQNVSEESKGAFQAARFQRVFNRDFNAF